MIPDVRHNGRTSLRAAAWPSDNGMEEFAMRMRTLGLLLAAGLAVGCQTSMLAPSGKLPVLFPGGGEFILMKADGTPTGYVFAEDDGEPGRQTLRWLLLEGYVSTTREPLHVARMVVGDNIKEVAGSAAEFADMARAVMKANPHCTYVKSYADSFSESYAYEGEQARTIVRVPVPEGRRAPEPPGALRPESWENPVVGKKQQIDGGTVGIKPGEAPKPTELVPGRGYLDPALLADPGVAGMAVGSPQRESNTDYWFLSDYFFKGGLDQTVIFPFANQQAAMTAPSPAEWAVVVVNSSYYPGFVPNDW